ncbi:hypothetical protein [Cardinium endosymbiont of Culicoides punctatus]|uniref:hypothetical protein n=1 Tax=Cardinium endosymbiont of Culicoides punctatus TaxID=2304601 RepID=UPI001058BBFC|nr:hypothetical protein [Cardinium endosymbiont of Culicoides punctatus]TDG95799.1 hypothetical protein CCPUN_00850 [Cardinium endosymbiont of Culicoides punctatus]
MVVGNHLKLFDRHAQWGILCEVTSKDIYASFEEMLQNKGVLPLLPQLASLATHVSNEELFKRAANIYHSFPGAHRVRQFGAVAIGVKYLQKI